MKKGVAPMGEQRLKGRAFARLQVRVKERKRGRLKEGKRR